MKDVYKTKDKGIRGFGDRPKHGHYVQFDLFNYDKKGPVHYKKLEKCEGIEAVYPGCTVSKPNKDGENPFTYHQISEVLNRGFITYACEYVSFREAKQDGWKLTDEQDTGTPVMGPAYSHKADGPDPVRYHGQPIPGNKNEPEEKNCDDCYNWDEKKGYCTDTSEFCDGQHFLPRNEDEPAERKLKVNCKKCNKEIRIMDSIEELCTTCTKGKAMLKELEENPEMEGNWGVKAVWCTYSEMNNYTRNEFIQDPDREIRKRLRTVRCLTPMEVAKKQMEGHNDFWVFNLKGEVTFCKTLFLYIRFHKDFHPFKCNSLVFEYCSIENPRNSKNEIDCIIEDTDGKVIYRPEGG